MSRTHINKWLLSAACVIGLSACTSAPSATPIPASPPVISPTTADAPAAVSAATPTSEGTLTPTIGAAAQPTATTAAAVETTVEATPTTAPQPGAQATKINLNTATAEQILAIPNTGNRMVREFMEYRPYTSIQQFRREIGKYVDDAQVAEYEKYVYVPVSLNDADPLTLQQLPGVTQAIADALIAARPYATADDFIAKLTELTSAELANAARAYLEPQ